MRAFREIEMGGDNGLKGFKCKASKAPHESSAIVGHLGDPARPGKSW